MISVVVPIYNVEKFINRCIDSIVNQTYTDLEIILVNDGSNDNSGQICDTWASKDNRIIVIHKANGGLSDARNAGLDKATGDYISFIDGDDSIELNTYEVAMSAIKRTGCQIAVFGKKKVYSDDRIRCTQNMKKEHVFSSKEAIDELFIGRYIDESFCDKLFSKAILDNFHFKVGEINEDLPMLPTIFEKSEKVVHLGQNLYHYYQNTGSITRSGYSKKMSVVKEHIEKLYDEYYVNHKHAWKMLAMRYSIAMVFRINTDIELFKEDYKWYKNIIKNNSFRYCCSSRTSIKDKILCILVLTNAYKFLHK